MDSNYIHNNLLRHFITEQAGQLLTETTIGDRNRRVYTYTVPVEFNINNCDIVAFVTRTDTEVLNGIKIKMLK